MKSNEDIVKETARKLLDFHLGKGPQPDWNDLFQGFCAAQELLVERAAQSRSSGDER